MKFLPSLLEYSRKQIENKLDLINNNLEIFSTIQKGQPPTGLHLDFVLPFFAKDRKVMTSLGLETVLETLNQYFKSTELDLSIHLMGTIEDLYNADAFLKNYAFNPNWQYTIYVPKNFTSTFGYHTQIFNNVEIGIWLDKNNWDTDVIKVNKEQANKFLLMTVVAGKSGQILEPTEILKLQQLCKTYPELHFLADGGWQIDTIINEPNLEIISYTSFWKTFEEKLKVR